MAFTYEQYRDFVQALREHPEWRAELRPIVLGEELLALPGSWRRTDERLDRLTAAVAELAEAQQRADERLDRLTVLVAKLVEAQARSEAKIEQLVEAQARTEAKIVQLVEAQSRTEARVDDLAVRMERVEGRLVTVEVRLGAVEGRLGNLEGSDLETRYRRNLGSFLRLLMARPRTVLADELPGLIEAHAQGRVSDAELDRIDNLDFLVLGPSREDGEDLLLACEVSHTVNAEDVTRAESAAETLRLAGYRARGFVGGYRIREPAQDLAAQLGVAVDLRRPPSVEAAAG